MAPTDTRDDWGFEGRPGNPEPEAAAAPEAAVGREDPNDRISLLHTLATAAIGLLLVTWLAAIALSAWWVVTRVSG